MIDETPEVRAAEPSAGAPMIRLSSTEVFRGRREVVIIHQNGNSANASAVISPP